MGRRIITLLLSIIFAVATKVAKAFSGAANTRHEVRPVLLYHSVLREERVRFADQMDTLVRLGRAVDSSRADHDAVGGHEAVITFDDGFRNFCENALPELVKRSIPATLFVPSGYLGKTADFSEKYGTGAVETVMDREELRDIPEDLVTIGSHCRTHRNLLQIDRDGARREIVGSKKDLEDLLEREVPALAFPYGAYNGETVELCREAGYKRVYASLPIPKKDGFLIGRIRTDPSDWPIEFRLKLMGSYQWLPWAIALKRKLKALIACG